MLDYMKITFILPGLSRYPVGGYKVVYEYANYFAQRGNQVSLVHVEQVPSGHVKMRVHLKNIAIKLKIMGKDSISWFNFDKGVTLKFISDFSESKIPDADVIIATAWYTASFVAKLSKNKGRKYYFIQHYEIQHGNNDLVDDSWRLPLKKIVIATWLQKIGNRLGVETEIIKNFVNHDEFFPTNSINRAPGISMLVHNESWKGSIEGIEVLKRVYKKYPKVKIMLFGLPDRPSDIPQNWYYAQKATPKQLRERIYGQSTIFLFPSHKEGWGLTATEAMACGNALVSTNNGGIDDFGFNGKNAIIVGVRDEIGMENALCSLLSNTDVMREYQLESIRISNKLTLESSGEKFLKIISKK